MEKLTTANSQSPEFNSKKRWSEKDIPYFEQFLLCCFEETKYSIGLHNQNFYEVNIVSNGSGEHYINGIGFAVRLGDVFVIPPGVDHGYKSNGRLNVYHLLIHPLFFDKYHSDLISQKGYHMLFTVEPFFRAETFFRYGLKLKRKDFARVLSFCRDLNCELRDNNPKKKIICQAMGLLIVSQLCRYYEIYYSTFLETVHVHREMKAISTVLEFIQAHYENKITLGELASAANLNQIYFSRLFKKITGMSPFSYLIEYRIMEAKNLLRETDLKITEIAQRTGFFDSAHFTKHFSRLAGMSPKRYRENILN